MAPAARRRSRRARPTLTEPDASCAAAQPRKVTLDRGNFSAVCGCRHGIWIVGLLAAALGAAAVGVHASSAAPTGPITHASTFDKTFSCRVRRQHFVNFSASATLPPVNGQRQPGGLYLTTVQKTREQNGATVTLTQVSLSARKNSLRIDMSTCNRVKRQIPLKPKGLPGPRDNADAAPSGLRQRALRGDGPGTRPTSVQDDERSPVTRVVRGPQRQREEPADRVLQLEPGQGQRVYGQQLRRQ